MKIYTVIQITYRNICAAYISDRHNNVLLKAPILEKNWWMIQRAEYINTIEIEVDLPYKKYKYLGIL